MIPYQITRMHFLFGTINGSPLREILLENVLASSFL
jgi:hypothetical protein